MFSLFYVDIKELTLLYELLNINRYSLARQCSLYDSDVQESTFRITEPLIISPVHEIKEDSDFRFDTPRPLVDHLFLLFQLISLFRRLVRDLMQRRAHDGLPVRTLCVRDLEPALVACDDRRIAHAGARGRGGCEAQLENPVRELVFRVAGRIGDGRAGDEGGDCVLRCKVLPRERGIRRHLLDGRREQRAEKRDRVHAAV